ncbi:MAG TPA: hypothetical protein VFO76_06785 [Candidatus Kapabacteria bacterium]|nr:hypothetical protein [Candidatus Kapabacteria bacterium]
MSRITQLFIAGVLLVVLAQSSLFAQGGASRTGGFGRLQLDDGLMNFVYLSNANGSVGIDATGAVNPTFPSACALLDLSSTTKGFLTPRMTTAQEMLICGGAPPEGLIVYNLSTHTLDIFNGSGWNAISGWTLVGNTLAPLGGGTGVLQNFIGTLNNSDFVVATNVNANGGVGSGNGERIRVASNGFVGINDAPNGAGPFNPATLFNVGGTAGTANVRFNSLSGAPLMAPPLAPATDGIVISSGAGDLLKYDIATVVGTVGWLRVGNTIIDGNNILGTLNDIAVDVRTNNTTAMTIGDNSTNNNIGIDAAPLSTWSLNVGGNGIRTTSQFTSAGNSTVGTNAGTTNTFGNGGAGTTNTIGNSATSNTLGNSATTNTIGTSAGTNNFGTSATTNNVGVSASTNNFGTSATTNNIGTNAVSTNNIASATTNINTGGAGNTNINTFAGAGNTTIGATNHTGTITLAANNANAITLDVANTANNLTLNNINQGLLATDVNFLVMTAPTSGAARWRTLSSFIIGTSGVEVTYAGGVADAHFAPNSGAVLFASDRFFNNNGFVLHYNNAGTDYATFAAASVNIMNNAANTGTVNIGNNSVTSGAITINSGNTAGGDITINTVNNAGVGSDLVLNGIENPAFAGNVLWLTPGNEVRQSLPGQLAEQDITWQLEATGTKVRLGARATDALGTNALLENRVAYLGGFNMNFSDNAGNNYLSLNDNANTTTLGYASSANTVTGNTNAITAVSTNTITGSSNAMTSTTTTNTLTANTTNNLIGGTGNNVTATTGNNAIAATTGANTITAATTNAMTANGTTNTLTANTTNNLVGGTGNNVTATTGNNAIAATTGANTITAATTNAMTANGTTNTLTANTTNNLVGGTGNNITATTGNNAITASAAAGQNNITSQAGGSNNITGPTNINTTLNGATTIGHLASNGAVAIRSNAAGSSITLDVANTANNLTVNNILQDNTQTNLLTLTGTNSGNVRTRDLGTLITGSNGVEVTFAAGVFDAHFGDANTDVPFVSPRFINMNMQTLSFTRNGGGNNVMVLTGGATGQVDITAPTNINTTATYAPTIVGNGVTSNQQLRVNGVADAVVPQTLAGNPTVWDFVVQGDQATTGIAKFGGSIWIDGASAVRNILADANLLVNTSAGGIELFPASGLTTLTGNGFISNNLVVNVSITASTGNITATTGDIVAAAGNMQALQAITAINNDIRANNGNIVANNGRIGAGTGVGAPTSTLTSAGSLSANTNTGGAVNLTISDFFYLVNTSNITVTLPSAVGIKGRMYIVKNNGTSINTTVNGGGSNIDGAANDFIGAVNSARQYISDGTNWWITSSN